MNPSIDNIAQNVYNYYDGRLISTNIKYYNDSYKLADEYLIKDIKNFGKILIFGFLYTDTLNANHSIVTPIAEIVKQQNFIDLMNDKEIRLV
jgi:hypothetical protein